MTITLNNAAFWISFFFIIISPIENILRTESIVYVVGVFLLTIIWIARQDYIFKWKTVSLAAFVIYCGLSCFWTPRENAFSAIIPTLAAFLFLILQLQFDYSERQYAIFKDAFIIQWGVLILLCCCFGTYMDGRFWLQSATSGADPNYLSGWFIIPVCFGIEKLISKNTGLVIKTCLSVLLGMTVYFVFQSGSRSGLIAVTVGATCSVLYTIKSSIRKNPIQAIVILVLFILLIVCAIQNMPEIMVTRLENSNANLGGRGGLWIKLLSSYFDSGIGIVTGLGYGATVYYNEGHVTAHNTYLDVLFNTGVIGVFCIMSFLISSFRRIVKDRPYTAIAFGAMTILSLTLSSLNTRFFMLSLFILGLEIQSDDYCWIDT